MREIRLSGLEGGVAVTAIPTPIHILSGGAIRRSQASLRDAIRLFVLFRVLKHTATVTSSRTR